MLVEGNIMNLKKAGLIIAVNLLLFSAAVYLSTFPSSTKSSGASAPPTAPAPIAGVYFNGDSMPAAVNPGDTKEAGAFLHKATSISEIDKHLKGMIKGNIAFSYPAEMEKDEIRVFKVKIGINKSQKELMEIIKAEGVSSGEKIVPGELKVSEIMVATLTGIGFKIDPLAPIEHPMSESKPTSWEWQIQALKAGKQPLTLKLEAVVSINGKERNYQIETFSTEIIVSVTTKDWIIDIFTKNPWLGGLIIPPVVAYLYRIYRNRNKLKPPRKRRKRR